MVDSPSGPETGPRRVTFLSSLRGKLIIVLTLFVGLTAFALSLNNYRYVQGMLRESVERQLTLQAEGLREVMLAYIGQQQERALLVASRTRLRALLREHLDGEIDEVTFHAQTSRILRDARNSIEGFREIRIADADGHVVTATEPGLTTAPVSELPAFTLGRDEATLGLPYPTEDGFEALLTAPARTNDGRFLGVVLVDVDVTPLREILSTIPSGYASAEVRLATREGDRIRYLFPIGEASATLTLAPDEDPAMWAALGGAAGFESIIDFEGREVLSAYRDIGYRGWALSTQVAADEAYAPISELSTVVVLSGSIVALLALLVGIRFAATFTRPVLDLARVASKLGAGDLRARASVGAHDEVGVTARAFNTMAESLERHQNHLEELVSQRTMVLNERTDQLQRSNDQLAELCELLEGQASVIERDLHRAEQIQRSLMPHDAPRLPDFCVQTLYRPGHNIGGDLYDVITVGDKYLVLLVADASGHGVSAAMLAVLFKHRLRVIDETTGKPFRPAQALTALNQTLQADIAAPGTFFTCAYCLLNTETHELVVASAGHPPVLCLKADGSVDQIEHTGPALGLFEEAVFSERSLTVEQGDSVLLFTDGLLDLGAEDPAPIETIAAILRAPSHRRVLDRVLAQVSGGREREDRDDVTMLLLDARPGEAHFFDRGQGVGLAVERDEAAHQVSVASSETETFICIEGRVTWTYGEALLDAADVVIGEGRVLVIDFSACEYLDSTMLGTLHELVRRAAEAGAELRLQRVPPAVREAFEELSMDVVIAHIAEHPEPVPRERTPIAMPATDLQRQRERLLRAHEALAELSKGNEDQFASVVEALRADLEEQEEQELQR